VRRAADRNGARHGYCAGVANAQSPFGNAKFYGDPRSATCEPDLRWRTRSAMNDHVGEGDARSEPCPQRFQDCLLRSEATDQALDPVGPLADVIEFLLREAAPNQRIARIVDPAPHRLYVHHIDPVPDNVHIHRRSSRGCASVAISHVFRRATARYPSG